MTEKIAMKQVEKIEQEEIIIDGNLNVMDDNQAQTELENSEDGFDFDDIKVKIKPLDFVPKSYESTVKDVRNLCCPMTRLFPAINFKQYDEYEYYALKSQIKVPWESKAILQGNVVVFPENLCSIDALLACFLCPFIDMVSDKYPELYEILKWQAYHELPRVIERLDEDYKELSVGEREKKCVTIFLSREMRCILMKGDDTNDHRLHFNSFRDFYFEYCRWEDDWTPRIFEKNERGDNIITMDDLTNIRDISDLAYILTTNRICFDVSEYIQDDAVKFYAEGRYNLDSEIEPF